MICLNSKLPVLQIGSHQLSNYETSWLLKSIQGALDNVEIENESIAYDIYSGVIHYLENDCPWVPLKIENLYNRVERLFDRIGFSHLKDDIPKYCPEMKISVKEHAQQLDYPIEISLFSLLYSELNALESYGARTVILEDIQEAVRLMIPVKKWNKRCQTLHDELMAIQNEFNQKRSEICSSAVTISA